MNRNDTARSVGCHTNVHTMQEEMNEWLEGPVCTLRCESDTHPGPD